MQTASIKGIFNNKAANVYVENLTDSNIELMIDAYLIVLKILHQMNLDYF